MYHNGQSDPKVYLDPTGEMSHFPRSLSLLVGPPQLIFAWPDFSLQYDDDGSREGYEELSCFPIKGIY
jgi:hypothetical protein